MGLRTTQKSQLSLLMALLLLPMGCEKAPKASQESPKGSRITVEGRTVEAPEGSKVTLEMRDKGAQATSKESRDARGVGLSTESKDAEQNFRPSSVSAGFDSQRTTGGGADYSGKLTGAAGFNLFHALGAIGLVVGIAYFAITKRLGTSLYIAACGLGLIAVGVAIDSYPMAWIAGLIAAAAAGGCWLFMAWRSKGLQQDSSEYEFFGKVVVSAYEKLPTDEAKKAFREAMEKVSGLENGKTREIIAYFRSKMGV